jgi:hypothetical protein
MKTKSTNPREDIQTIREIMERSSKFLSLSGLSGVVAGVCALTGAAVAWFIILDSGRYQVEGILHSRDAMTGSATGFYLALDALLVLVFTVLGAFYLSYRKARKAGQQFFSNSARRLLIHLMIPLVSGGVFTLILLFHNLPELVPSAMLIFYGLSLVNAMKVTFVEIHYLGITQIGLGILAGIFIHQGLLLWTIGFGVMHIVYGIVMFYRYDR